MPSRKPLFVVKRGNVIFCPAYGRRFKKQFDTHDEAREYCDVLRESIKHLTIAEIERFISSQEFAWGQVP